MARIPEVQRLLARGEGTLPQYVFVDVGALVRWRTETAPKADVLAPLMDIKRRTHRRIVVVVAPTTTSWPDSAELSAAHARLVGELAVEAPNVLRSSEPLPALLANTAVERECVMVSAGIDGHWHELHVLANPKVRLLDISTGRVWDRALTSHTFGRPEILPELWAATAHEPDQEPIVREATSYTAPIRAALEAGRAWHEAATTRRVRQALRDREEELRGLASLLRGRLTVDSRARSELLSKVQPWPVFRVSRAPDTAYVTAVAERTDDTFQFREVWAQVGQEIDHARGADRSVALLADLPGSTLARWVAPRSMDLLDALVDSGLELPRTVIDPGIAGFVWNPDEPPDPAGLCSAFAGVSTGGRAWIQDVKREQQPPPDLEAIARGLRQWERQYPGEVRRLLEEDLGCTLPALARLERQGAVLGSPAGSSSYSRLGQQLEREALKWVRKNSDFLGGLDPVHAPCQELITRLWARGIRLPPDENHPDMDDDDKLERLEHRGSEEAGDLRRIRSLLSGSGVNYWLRLLSDGRRRVRGLQFPLVTGRFAFRDPPLHNVPKRSEEGKAIRAGLLPPPGYLLLGADYNAFEARLLAAASGDPVLNAAAQKSDLHDAMAERLFGKLTKNTRNRAKAGVYAIVYGQTSNSFWMSQPRMSKDEALTTFDKVVDELPAAMSYRDEVLEKFRSDRYVETEGGWYRAPLRRTQAFNTTVQALAADVFRWVIRRLDGQLPKLGGFLVHQAHDEVLAAVPPDRARQARQLIERTMDDGVRFESDLLPNDVPLPAKAVQRTSWAETH